MIKGQRAYVDPVNVWKKVDENFLLTNLKSGPVVIAIEATNNLQNYKSGILSDSSCSSDLSPNHAVMLVGREFKFNNKNLLISQNILHCRKWH